MLTLDQAYNKIDGMEWTLDDVHGVLSVEKINGMTEVVHTASAKGRKSATYKSHRRELGDDYTTQVTADDDVIGAIFAKASE